MYWPNWTDFLDSYLKMWCKIKCYNVKFCFSLGNILILFNIDFILNAEDVYILTDFMSA